jgi:hypothetical protein
MGFHPAANGVVPNRASIGTRLFSFFSLHLTSEQDRDDALPCLFCEAQENQPRSSMKRLFLGVLLTVTAALFLGGCEAMESSKPYSEGGWVGVPS